jgi:Secretion system C-terminal sorting domain
MPETTAFQPTVERYQMNTLHRSLALLTVLLLLAGTATAQWSDDPATNLLLSSGPGEQTTPIVEPTSDGGCWVLYYSNASGNYDVYLQKLDADGNVQWGNGFLVSDNAQNSWITEWDFAVDANDNAIVCTNDVRDGVDWDVYGYSIAPDGTFNWGADGVTLSNTDADDLAQQIMVASNGDVVFGWMSDSVVNLRRINPAGADVWDPAIIEISSEFPVSIPRFAPTSDGGFLLQYLVAQGSMFWSPKHLYINRFDTAGQPQWAADGVALNVQGGFGIQMRPDLISDGNDGAISYWYGDPVFGQLQAYVQHTRNDGIVLWDVDGMLVSTSPDLHFMPSAALDEANGFIYLVYGTSNGAQSQYGVGAQKLDMNGNRLWTDNGVVVVPLGDNQPYSEYGFLADGGGVMLSWLENVFGGTDTFVKAARLDENGTLQWGGTTQFLSNVESDKLHHSAAMTTNGQLVSVWVDKRNDTSGDLYAQNINPDGTLGPLPQNDPIYIELLNPSPTVFPAGGGTLNYDVHVVNDTATPYANIHYFTEVELPNGNVLGPLVDTQFTLAAGMDVTVAGPAQDIPSFAPVGIYTHFGSMGYVNGPHLTDSFQFEKTGVAADGTNDWDTHGEFVIADDAVVVETLPNEFALSEAYPNPFNPSTTITVALPVAAELYVAVFNTLGRQVAELANGPIAAGTHQFTVNGSSLASGIYFVQATVPSELNAVQKIVLMK